MKLFHSLALQCYTVLTDTGAQIDIFGYTGAQREANEIFKEQLWHL